MRLERHGETQLLSTETLAPEADPRWHLVAAPFETDGDEVALVLETDPGSAGNSDFDWALWADSKVECGDRRFLPLALVSAIGFGILVARNRRREASLTSRHASAHLVLPAASVVGVLLLLELAMRAAPAVLPTAVLESAADARLRIFPARDSVRVFDPELGYLYRPNRCWTYEPPRGLIDSEELSAAYVPPPLPAVTNCSDEHGFLNPTRGSGLQVAAIGDSFTAAIAYPRERAWPGVLASDLGVSVANFGLTGYGPGQYQRVLERFVLSAHPRTVVVGFFEGNDFDDMTAYLDFRASGVPFNQYEASLRRLNFGSTPVPRLRRSLLGSTLWLGARSLERHLGLGLDPVGEVLGRGFNPMSGRVSGREIQAGAYGIYLRHAARSAEQVRELPGFRPTLESLRKIRDLCRENGIGLLVALLPSGESIYPAVLASNIDPALFASFVGAAEGGAPSWSDFLAHRKDTDRVLLEALAGEEIPAISLFEPFESAASSGETLYLVDDSHWNERGHALAAEIIGSELRRRSAVPTSGAN